MSDLVHPGEIPVLAADLATLEQTVGDLSRAGAATYRRGETIRTTYLSLGEHHDAPETPELLGSIASVGTLNEELHDATAGAAQHLERYVEQARSLARSLTGLRERAEVLQNAADPADITTAQRAESEAIRGALRTALTDYHATETHAARAVADLLATHSGTAVLERAAALSGAERAVALMRRDDLTQAELAELDRLLATHSENDHFAGYLLDTLGVAELARQAARFENVDYLSTAPSSPEDPFPVNSLVVGLANVFATATRTPERLKDAPPESAEFTEWLRTPEGRDWQRRTDAARAFAAGPETGLTPFDTSEYGTLLTFMGHATTPFSAQLMDGLVADLENSANHAPYSNPAGGERSHLDHALEISARNPDAATMILDLKRSDRAERWMEEVCEYEQHPYLYGMQGGGHTLGLNLAFSSAATGLPEGAVPPTGSNPPSTKNVEIAQFLIDRADRANRADREEIYPRSISLALGNTIAGHIGHFNKHFTESPLPSFEHGPDLSNINVDSVLQFAGEDEDAFTAVRDAQIAYAGVTSVYLYSDAVDLSPCHQDKAMNTAASTGGKILGTLTHARSDQEYNEGTSSLDSGLKRASQHLLTGITDATFGQVPGFGTAAANEMVSANNELWSEHEKRTRRNAAEDARTLEEITVDSAADAYALGYELSLTRKGDMSEDETNAATEAVARTVESGFTEVFSTVLTSMSR
ncbi:hypothetical protein [Streptomyces lonarensis]|uniref:Uncharacterized protein n=1 Tax=Streptomyces lonarensis TaxID=700599 RepID=A0A7X6D237_9ACTN|nr:hypothetical protein [Streptomyces lonarensis]NJQ06801.1 hypothetical protein [Streptomyces lonarensis]